VVSTPTRQRVSAVAVDACGNLLWLASLQPAGPINPPEAFLTKLVP
jgi:hypothetical protein